VKDVSLPKWAFCNPRYFVNANRKALESIYAHNHIHEWINLIFGFKQLGDSAIEALNVFYPLTYENSVNLDEMLDINERNGILDQISEYGQTPKQLFKKPHPEKKKLKKIKFLLYNPIQLKNVKPVILLNCNDQLAIKEKFIRFNDFLIRGECENEHFEGLKGLSSFIVKKGIKMNMKERQNNILIKMKGCSFYGNSSKFISYDNCYKMLLMFEWKLNEMKYLKYWSFEHETPTSFLISKQKDYLILGDKFGSIRTYKICKKTISKKIPANFYDLNLIKNNKNIVNEEEEITAYRFRYARGLFEPVVNEKNTALSKKSTSKTEKKKRQIHEIRIEQKKSSKCHFIKININETGKKLFKYMSFTNLHNEIIYTKRDFMNFYDVIFNNFVKNEKGISTKETDSLKFDKLLMGHATEITCFELCYSFSLLISCDNEGVICLWEISKGKLIQKIYTYHFIAKNNFKEICYDDFKEFSSIGEKTTKLHKMILQREKIKGISVCQENGDFAIISENYLSVYSINGVLISILNRSYEKLSKFSSSLITQVSFNYIYLFFNYYSIE